MNLFPDVKARRAPGGKFGQKLVEPLPCARGTRTIAFASLGPKWVRALPAPASGRWHPPPGGSFSWLAGCYPGAKALCSWNKDNCFRKTRPEVGAGAARPGQRPGALPGQTMRKHRPLKLEHKIFLSGISTAFGLPKVTICNKIYKRVLTFPEDRV